MRSDHGELHGVARVGPIRRGDVQVHWPEGNVLLARDARSPESRVPDYNTRVSVEPRRTDAPGAGDGPRKPPRRARMQPLGAPAAPGVAGARRSGHGGVPDVGNSR